MSHYPPVNNAGGWPPSSAGGWPPGANSNYPPVQNHQPGYPSNCPPVQNNQPGYPSNYPSVQQNQPNYPNNQSSYPSHPPHGSGAQYGQQGYSSYHPPSGAPPQPNYHGQTASHAQPAGYPGASHASHAGYAAPAAGAHGAVQGHVMGAPARAVLGQQFCAQQERVFLLREKVLSWSGDDFEVLDAQSHQKVYKLDSSAVSIRDHRVLKDAFTLKAIATMKKKIFSRNSTWMVCHPGTEQLAATIKKRTTAGPPTADIFLGNNTSAHFSTPRPDYTITGDFRTKNMFVYHMGHPCAEVTRKVNTWKKALGADSYALRVFPGFDYAFLLCLVLTVDELYND